MQWAEMAARLKEAEFDDFRDGLMCCFNIYNTAQRQLCSLCNGLHAMVERRFECGSLDCYRVAVALEEATAEETKEDGDIVVIPKRGRKKSPCPCVWKVQHCTVHGYYRAEKNDKAHLRGSIACTVVGMPKLTNEMKAFLEQEDKDGSAPRNILVKMKANPHIKKPRRGWPTPQQIANAMKYIRRKNGTNYALAAIEKLVRDWHFHPGIDSKTVFLFGPLLDDDGHVHVGSGGDDDPLIIGVTSTALLENCAKFMSPDQPTIFHADGTIELSGDPRCP